jgi:hypothetical protein
MIVIARMSMDMEPGEDFLTAENAEDQKDGKDERRREPAAGLGMRTCFAARVQGC